MKKIFLLLSLCLLILLAACSTFAPQPTLTPAPTATSEPTATPVPTEIPSPGPGWTLVWADEFDQPDGSRLDPEYWNYQTGTGNGGWGNNESQFYTDRVENSFIEDGKLVIQAIEEQHMGAKYTSARVNTMVKAEFLYGRFEARAKMPNTQGIWPAIWMMPTLAKYGNWPASGEIDIVEMIGRDPYAVHGTIHYGNPHGDRSGSYFLPTYESFDKDFHVFAIEWEPDEIRWYVDDEQYHSAKSNEWFTSYTDAPSTAPFDQPFHWILNVAVGGNWPGYPNDGSEFPQRMEVDYVRVYQQDTE